MPNSVDADAAAEEDEEEEEIAVEAEAEGGSVAEEGAWTASLSWPQKSFRAARE